MSDYYKRMTVSLLGSTNPDIDNTLILQSDHEEDGRVYRLEAYRLSDEAADDIESLFMGVANLASRSTEYVYEVDSRND